MINGDRVRQAREFRGLTQTELAMPAGVSQPFIASVEAGLSQPSDDVVAGMAFKTGFPPSFFRQAAPPQFALGSLLFRAKRSMSMKQRNQVRCTGELAYETTAKMAKRVEQRHRLHLPELEADTPPHEAAELVRSALGQSPNRPIGRLVSLLENAGVVIIAYPDQIPKHDAYSLWVDAKPRVPLIAISANVPGDRLRFSVAHELGHLVLHAAYKGAVATVEKEANRFASSFLLPHDSMMSELASPVSLASLRPLKARWGVSLQALIMRAADLGLVSAGQKTYLFRQLTARGWRKHEPDPVPVERPRAFRKMAELLYGDPVDVPAFARDSSLPTAVIKQLVDAHASVQDMAPRAELGTENVIHLRPS